MLDSAIKILYPSESELLFAYRFFKTALQKQLSVIEVVNARLMEKHGISNVLTFDYWRNVSGTTISELIKN